MKNHTVEQAVRYAETDRMQVVHHSTYLLWFEIGRTGLLAEIGFPYGELERAGTLFPVIEYRCHMGSAVDFGDTVRIETTVSSVRSRSVVFSYEVSCRGTVIASGETTHIAMNEGRKAKRFPEALLKALRDCAGLSNES
jgi:acyl-CoA thioester hydrolase